jgi:hypothetical protein
VKATAWRLPAGPGLQEDLSLPARVPLAPPMQIAAGSHQSLGARHAREPIPRVPHAAAAAAPLRSDGATGSRLVLAACSLTSSPLRLTGAMWRAGQCRGI